MPSLYDPSTYLKGLKGAKSLLTTLREKAAPQPKGVLDRIRSEVSQPQPKGVLANIKADRPVYGPQQFIGPQLPSVKEKDTRPSLNRFRAPLDIFGSGKTPIEKPLDTFESIKRAFDFKWKPSEDIDLKKPDKKYLNMTPKQRKEYVKVYGEKGMYEDQTQAYVDKKKAETEAEIAKVRKPLGKSYVEPIIKWNLSRENVKNFKESMIERGHRTMNDLRETFGVGAETIGKMLNKPAIESFGANYALKMNKAMAENPEWEAPTSSIAWQDPDWYLDGVSSAVGSMAMYILPTVLGTMIAPGLGTVAGLGMTASMGAGEAYKRGEEEGLSEKEKLEVAAKTTGPYALAEFMPGAKILKKVKGGKKVYDRMLNSIINKGQRFFAAGAPEALTEPLQSHIINTVIDDYKENRSDWEILMANWREYSEEAFFGFLGGGISDVAASGVRGTPEAIQTLAESKGGFHTLGGDVERGKMTSQKGFDMVQREGITTPAELPDTIPTTRILEDLKGKDRVSKQFIQDLTNQPQVKQAEREVIRGILDEYEGGKINVKEFENKVRTALVPLEERGVKPRYENVSLPDELKGEVENYFERVYESPIKTSAGNIHFRVGATEGQIENYFAHTRIEDIPGDIRRVIEVQSDLFQKGRLEAEKGIMTNEKSIRRDQMMNEIGLLKASIASPSVNEVAKESYRKRLKDWEKDLKEFDPQVEGLAKLEPYRNTYHERIIREEVKRAAEDGKTKILFPTGETAMKIEGLGEVGLWMKEDESTLKIGDLEVGKFIIQDYDAAGGTSSWIITEVLEDGKFKAVQEDLIKDALGEKKITVENIENLKELRSVEEQFDISEKLDTNNPIYRFYEKDIQKYLNREYGIKTVTDPQGVTWYQVEITSKLREDVAKRPVFAYKKTPEESLPERARAKAEAKVEPQQIEEKPTQEKPSSKEVAREFTSADAFIKSKPEILHGTTGEMKTERQLRDFYGQGIRSQKASEIKKATEVIVTKQAERALESEITRATIEGITDEDIKLFDRLRRIQDKYAEGDIETIRKNEPELLESALERFNEATGQTLVDTEAFDEIMGLPSMRTLREQEKGLTREERQMLRMGDILSEKETMQRRRVEIRAIQRFLDLSDKDLRKITQRDIRFMTNEEFNQFIHEMRVKAIKFAENKQAKLEVTQFIDSMDFKNWENLQKAMKLPTIPNMTTPQVRQFHEALMPYQKGDVFLGKRMIEVIEKIDLGDIKTRREGRDRMLQEPIIMKFMKDKGVSEGQALTNIDFTYGDRFKFDSILAEKDIFKKLLVEEHIRGEIKAEAAYLETKTEFLDLYKKAYKSRKRGIKEKIIHMLVPQAKGIIRYIEFMDERSKMGGEMTTQEIDLARFMIGKYKDVYDYLVMMNNEFGSRFSSGDYYTHKRMKLIESIKESGVKDAFGNIFSAYKEDAEMFNILDQQTDQILPLNKFFQNALYRSGEVTPSQNIVDTFLGYQRIFHKKKMLDEFMPKIMLYATLLENDVYTQAGIKKDTSPTRFVKEWINNKKGRKATVLVKQGDKADVALKGLNTAVSLKFIGLGIASGLASNAGETLVTYTAIGKKRMALGLIRKVTPKGRAILKKYKNFTGENPWGELIESGKIIDERFMEMVFILFKDANVRANRTMLLGSMTKEEFESGEISDEKLAELKLAMGRWRDIGGESIIGSTTEAAVVKKFLGWAIPPAVSITKDIKIVLGYAKERAKGNKTVVPKKEAMELVRVLETIALFMVAKSLASDEDDDSIVGQTLRKILREMGTLLQTMSPTTWLRNPPLMQQLTEFADLVESFIKWEKYKESGEFYEKGDLKAVRKFKKFFTPTAVKQFGEEPREEYRVKQSFKKEVLPEEDRKIYFDDLKEQNKEGDLTKEKAIEKMKEYDRWQGYMRDVEKISKFIDSRGMEGEELDRFKEALQNKDFMDKRDMKPFNKTQMKALEDYGKVEVKEGEKKTKAQYLEQRGAFGLTSDYIKAFMTDPANAWKALATKEKLGIVEGNLVELQRFYGIKFTDKGGSQERKKELMEKMGISWDQKDDYKLEHILPVTAGGDTSDKNLVPVTNDLHNLYTPIDIALGIAVKNEEITRKKANQYAIALKIDQTMTPEEVIAAL